MISCTCSIGSAYCSAPSVNTTSCRAWVSSDILPPEVYVPGDDAEQRGGPVLRSSAFECRALARSASDGPLAGVRADYSAAAAGCSNCGAAAGATGVGACPTTS